MWPKCLSKAAAATVAAAAAAAKQFVSPPSNLSSKANVLQFVNKKISSLFCVLGLFAVAWFFAPACLHCLRRCFISCTQVLAGSHTHTDTEGPYLALPFTHSLALAESLSIANENCTRMLRK